MSLEKYITDYLEACRVQGQAEGTLCNKHYALHLFLAWCLERHLTEADALTPALLERYQRYVYHARQPNGKALGAGTQGRRLTSVKMLYKWLVKKGEVTYNPASELDLPRCDKTLPRALLSVEEVEQVLEQARYTLHGIRDRAILETLYATGIRRTELARLDINDVDLDHQTLMVRLGKGKKDRMVPIGERACHWIRRYLEEERPRKGSFLDPDALFLNRLCRRFKPYQLSDHIRYLLRRAGINKPGACHLFRHAMATHMLENDAELRYIQAMLGHADISTTQIYTRVSMKKLRDVYTQTHPAQLDSIQQTPAETCDDVTP